MFYELRNFLFSVKNSAREIELLEKRISYCEEAGCSTERLEEELESAKKKLGADRVRVSGFIANLQNPGQQMVMMKRYVDLMTWEEIASDMSTGIRTVQKLHGKALLGLDWGCGE